MIVDRIKHWARRSPARPALADTHRVVTFGQLWEEIASCATLLSAHGVGERETVGLLLPNAVPFVAALFGIATAGSGAILFPPSLTPSELLQYCRETGARLVLTDPDHRLIVEAAGGRLAGHGSGGVEAFGLTIPPAKSLKSGDFIGQLTSGADRLPKIAIRTHAAVWNEIEDFSDEIALTADDGVLVFPSIAHSYGLIGGTLAPLCRGGRVILRDRFVSDEVVELVRRDRPTILYAVPVMYRALTMAPAGADELATLRLCFSAGAPLPRDVDDTFALRFGRRISQNYGTTEAGVISLRLEWTPRLQGSVGRPVRHRTVTIVDADGRTLSPGSVGVVMVQSPALARGYLDGAQRRETALEGGRLSTGDLGWVSEDGYLFLTGRASQIVRIGGTAVDLAEVEGVIGALPGVQEAAVVEVHDPEGEARLKAVVVAEGLRATDVFAHCRRHLSRMAVPEIVEFRGALPRTAAGKILRRALRDGGE
jgi:long-chain acyl-CoA synthetase